MTTLSNATLHAGSCSRFTNNDWERVIDNYESAFPNEGKHANNHPEGGLTKRELFAAMALQGMRASDLWSNDPGDRIAGIAVADADALIAALSEQQP